MVGWADPWSWISALLGIAAGVVMFFPFGRMLKWRARMLERMETAPHRTAISIAMGAVTIGWVIVAGIAFLFLPPMLLPHGTGIIYIAGFILGMMYKRPRFNREMESIGVAPHATRRRPGAQEPP